MNWIKFSIFVGLILLNPVINSFGQDNRRFLISAGYGENEFLNLSVGYQFTQSSISFSMGYEPTNLKVNDLSLGIL